MFIESIANRLCARLRPIAIKYLIPREDFAFAEFETPRGPVTIVKIPPNPKEMKQ